MTRRSFVGKTGAAIAAGLAGQIGHSADTVAGEKPLIVSTWPFGKASNDEALRVLLRGGGLADAVEQGIKVTEADAKNGSVGLGGGPNAAGVVQLDACIMLGPGHKAGSVAGLEGIKHPISAARRVMEKTRHVMLVGEGAQMFAVAEGLEFLETHAGERHEIWRKNHPAKTSAPARNDNHDTIALLVLGADGNIAGGCSTSGLSGKLPGRVGDSPIIGSGLYVDNEVGAAGATGIGENVMRFCGSFQVVELMRQGMHPEAACQETIRRIARHHPKGAELHISFVALDKKGRFGAAGSDSGFQFSVTTKESSRVLTAPPLS